MSDSSIHPPLFQPIRLSASPHLLEADLFNELWRPTIVCRELQDGFFADHCIF